MGGGLMQLVAYGAQDIYLTGNPQITFFKVVYRRHTNFSMECIQQTISGASTTEGGSGTVTISRNGDLVSKVYVRCDQDTTDGISGDKLVSEVELEIGGQRIDRHYEEWNQVWAELTTPESKAAGYKYLTGGFSNTLVSGGGTNQQSIMVPLQFWFCRNPGLALPLIALQYHEVKLKFTWGALASVARDDGTLGTAATCEVWADYIYLDTDERRRFAQVSHEYLIEQVQRQAENTSNTSFKLNFNHPVKELIWTDTADEWTTAKAKLQLNGHDRFAEQDREYFQVRQPLDCHTAVPGYNVKETERPQLLTTPITITSDIDMVASDTPNADGEFQVLDAATSNLKLFTATATDVDIKVGDIVSMVYPCAANEYVSAVGVISDIVTAPADGAAAVYTMALTNGIQADNRPTASTAGDGALHIIARVQGAQSRCSQLARAVNVYSFALKPEEHQPSGTCNFSRIDNAQLVFSSATNVGTVYAVNYNVLRIMSGMGGLAYSN